MPKIIQKEIISERLHKLREKMKPENIDMVILSNTDYHNSEYSSEYFKGQRIFLRIYRICRNTVSYK